MTPAERHSGRDVAILRRRDRTYKAARRAHPQRWSGATRDWSPVAEVRLNPARPKEIAG